MHDQTTGVMLISGEQCFAEIAGIPLWQRLLLSAPKAGVHAWVLLAWHDVEELRFVLATEAKFKDISYQVHDMAELTPAQLAVMLPPEDVLMISCIAALDHHTLRAVQQATGPALGITTNAVAATSGVVMQDGRVVEYPVDASGAYHSAGILRCPGVLLGRAMAQAWAAALPASQAFDALLPRLMAATSVEVVDLDPYLWVPIVAPFSASVEAAETELLRRLGRPGDSPVVRQINRRLSRRLTKRLMRTTITPNRITLVSALIGLSGAFLLAQSGYLAQVLGSLLFLGSTIIDGCDGEIARLTFQESDFGSKLDLTMDNLVHLCLFPAIALGLYRETHDPVALLLGGLALGGVLLSMMVYLPALWRRAARRSWHDRLHESLASRDFAYILLVLAFLDKLDWFLWATVGGTGIFAIAWVVLSHGQRR